MQRAAALQPRVLSAAHARGRRRSCARRARSSRSCKPAFCSVTFGAGGSTREGTLATVLEIRARRHGRRRRTSRASAARATSHRATCSRSTAARHPPPRRAARRPAVGHAPTPASSATRASSSRSSATRRATGSTSTSPRIPNTIRRRASPQDDLGNFKRKVDAGANSAITQYFFNADAYWHFVDACARSAASPCRSCRASCRSRSFTKLARFSDACGAEIPRWIRRKLEGYGDDTASIRAFGLDVVTELCAGAARARRAGPALLHAEPGALTTTIWRGLGLPAHRRWRCPLGGVRATTCPA